jgi:outer membrane immunogenic protein
MQNKAEQPYLSCEKGDDKMQHNFGPRVWAFSLVALIPAVPALAGGMNDAASEPMVMAQPVMAAPPSMDWTGFYAGASLGYGDIDSNGGGLDGNGALGGVLAGYRFDFGNLVAGVEADYDVTNISLGGGAGDLDSVARLKLQAGTELGRALVYGTLGAAQAKATVAGTGLSDTGYFGGVGMDYAITDRVSVGGELLKHKFNDFDGSGVDLDATTLKARVALQF